MISVTPIYFGGRDEMMFDLLIFVYMEVSVWFSVLEDFRVHDRVGVAQE